MTSDFTQLHDHVHETRLALFLARETVDGVDVLLEHGAIPLALHLGERDEDVGLLLCDEFSAGYIT